MDLSSIPGILQQIEESPLHTIPYFLRHILDSEREEYKVSAAAIKSPPGTHLILDSLLHASRPTVIKWAVSITTDILKQEIIRALNIETGLHFNATHARSADLVGFDLAWIVETFEGTAPLTWNLVQTLLAADETIQSRRQKSRKQAVDYASRHDPLRWSEGAMGGAASQSGGKIIDEEGSDGEIGHGGEAQNESTEHSKSPLLRIVSNPF